MFLTRVFLGQAGRAGPLPKATNTLVLRPQRHTALAGVTRAGTAAMPCPPGLPPHGLRGDQGARALPTPPFGADSAQKCHC